MPVPTQATGTDSPASAQQTNGFLGWSPDADRSVYTVTGTSGSGVVRGAYNGATAYVVGDVVTGTDGFRYRKLTPGAGHALPAHNASNANWTPVGRGPAEQVGVNVERKQFYR
jgi:hypothetical protein